MVYVTSRRHRNRESWVPGMRNSAGIFTPQGLLPNFLLPAAALEFSSLPKSLFQDPVDVNNFLHSFQNGRKKKSNPEKVTYISQKFSRGHLVVRSHLFVKESNKKKERNEALKIYILQIYRANVDKMAMVPRAAPDLVIASGRIHRYEAGELGLSSFRAESRPLR